MNELEVELRNDDVRRVADAAVRQEFGVGENGVWVYHNLAAVMAGQRSPRDAESAGWRYVREAKKFIAMWRAIVGLGEGK